MAKKSVAGTVLDPTIQFADLAIDGTQYRLAYSFNAIAEAEAAAGCNLLTGLESLRSLTAMQLRGLLYGALRLAHPDTTIEQAGKLIRLDTLSNITEALAHAYRLSMPEKELDPPAAGETAGAPAAA